MTKMRLHFIIIEKIIKSKSSTFFNEFNPYIDLPGRKVKRVKKTQTLFGIIIQASTKFKLLNCLDSVVLRFGYETKYSEVTTRPKVWRILFKFRTEKCNQKDHFFS